MALEYLDLSYTDIKSIPQEIKNLTRLKELSLEFSKRMTSFPEEVCAEHMQHDSSSVLTDYRKICALQCLEVLNLSLTKIRNISPEVYTLPHFSYW